MPWHLEERDGEFCVIKDDDGHNQGCHETREEAVKQMRALYANEESMTAAAVVEAPPVEWFTRAEADEPTPLTFTDDAVRQIARIAAEVNDLMENIGARRLHTVMTRLLDDILFDVPDVQREEVVIEAADVRDRLRGIVEDQDLRKYIL